MPNFRALRWTFAPLKRLLKSWAQGSKVGRNGANRLWNRPLTTKISTNFILRPYMFYWYTSLGRFFESWAHNVNYRNSSIHLCSMPTPNFWEAFLWCKCLMLGAQKYMKLTPVFEVWLFIQSFHYHKKVIYIGPNILLSSS